MPRGIFERSPELRQKLREKILKQFKNDSRIGFKKGNTYHKFKKGNKFSFPKDHVPWNKGKKGVQDISYMIGEKHYLWKGSKASYTSIHSWVRRHLGTPDKCEHCLKIIQNKKGINWANKSHEYKRELTDWIRLCVPCHRKYDKKS